MQAAAQAAAEAALREALAQDRPQSGKQQQQQQDRQPQHQQQHHQHGQPQQQQVPMDGMMPPMPHNNTSLQQQQQQQQFAQQHQQYPPQQQHHQQQQYQQQQMSHQQPQHLMEGHMQQQQQHHHQQQHFHQQPHEQEAMFHQQQQQQQHMTEDEMMMDMLYQEQQQQQQSQNPMEAQMFQQQQQREHRPREHYMTITKDGTIVEASNTVIGFPPEALLMTSTYDTLFDEDLPGFLCVKSQFWDLQKLDVSVYIRRRSLDGEWVWLCSQAVQWMEENDLNQGMNGMNLMGSAGNQMIVLVERVVDDIPLAQHLNRAIRITAIVVQAVEAARLTQGGGGDDQQQEEEKKLKHDESRTLLNETAEMELLLRRLQENGNITESNSGGNQNKDWNQLLEIATTQGGVGGNNNNNGSGGADDPDDLEAKKRAAKQFDPYGMIESVRKGIRLDLGLTTSLQPPEVRLLTMVLTGELPVDQVAPLVLQSIQSSPSPYNTAQSLNEWLLWHKQQQQQQQQQLVQQQQQQQQPPRQAPQSPQRRRRRDGSSSKSSKGAGAPVPSPDAPPANPPPPIAVVNLSYTYIHNVGVEVLSEALFCQGSALRTLDISFCGIDEKGFLALAKALTKRKKRNLTALKGLILSGNTVTQRAASELGAALALPSLATSNNDNGRNKRRNRGSRSRSRSSRRRSRPRSTGGYDSDSSDSDEDDDFDDFSAPASNKNSRSGRSRGSSSRRNNSSSNNADDDEDDDSDNEKKKEEEAQCCSPEAGIQVLHLASTSLKAAALGRLLEGLGPHSSLKELNISSNLFGAAGASVLSRCLEKAVGGGSNSMGPSGHNHSHSKLGKQKAHVPLPYLDRIDISNNALGDEGATQLTKIISSRSQAVDLIDLRLSSNSISPTGIEKIMNKLLHHNLISLALDKNAIGDQGCQLVAASLQSMKSLGRLNLNFNQIGSRGIHSLMRSLIACETVTFLGLSGNILKISGAMALAFTLAQHPRLEELHLDNCCLGQAAQCHIVAGIISNRWVPMKRLAGYAVGPPLVAIGALQPYAQNLSNEECFRIRKDEQMKTILQWMESHKRSSSQLPDLTDPNAGGGATASQQPIMDPSAAKLDPAILSALGGGGNADVSLYDQRFLTPEVVSNINQVHGTPSQNAYYRMVGWLSSIPFDDDELTVLQKYFYDVDGGDGDRGSDGYINLKLRGDLLAALDSEIADEIRDVMPASLLEDSVAVQDCSVGVDLDKLFGLQPDHDEGVDNKDASTDKTALSSSLSSSSRHSSPRFSTMETIPEQAEHQQAHKADERMEDGAGMAASSGEEAPATQPKDKKVSRAKPRITLFPRFEQQLEQLKSAAAEMIEQEEDPMHHEVILTQYAEASLTMLRQLRYHCMNSGLDGWRQGAGNKRKVLIVDDSKITRRMVQRAFEKQNFIVDTAANGAEGVEKLKASIYAIAFMDIDMPVMNGFEATKKLREWEDAVRPGARQPICALTAAYVDDFERSELMKFKEAGLDVMESKPCNMPRLFKVVDDVSPMFSDLFLNVRSSSGGNGEQQEDPQLLQQQQLCT